MKVLYLVADGMGDWPHEDFGGKTPLETAETPNMDELARIGMVGRCATIPENMAPGSDVANMALLGFDPQCYHTGRGPIEAAAQGLQLDAEDLVWRLNLVTVTSLENDGTMLDYSSGHISTEESRPLVERLQSELGGGAYEFIPGIQYRHLLVQKSAADSLDATLAISPPHDILDQPIKGDLKRFMKNPALWDLLFDARDVLAHDNATKANSIWPWGQGKPLILPDFEETFGVSGAVISAVDLIKGLGNASGMKVLDIEGATGLLDTNYEGKVEATLEFLKDGDFAFVHLEGPDECGHGGDFEEKTEAIARFDARIVAPLRKALEGEDVLWVICCDHYTPIVERTHTKDPVPFIIAKTGPNSTDFPASGLALFNEHTADSTGLTIDAGHELLPYALKQSGIVK